MALWNINEMRALAGMPLTESWDDGEYDDEDPDVKIAAGDKKQSEFEKRAARAKDDGPAVKAKPTDSKKAEPKAAEPKADAKPAADGESKAEPVKRGAKPRDDSKMGKGRAWLAANPGATRKEFMGATEHHGMTAHHANAFFYSHKKKMSVSEGYMLVHPAAGSYFLAENYEMNRLQWVTESSDLDPLFYETLEEAEKMVKHLAEWKSQHAKIEHIVF